MRTDGEIIEEFDVRSSVHRAPRRPWLLDGASAEAHAARRALWYAWRVDDASPPPSGSLGGQTTLERLRKRRQDERAVIVEEQPRLKYQAKELDLAQAARRLGAEWLVSGVRDVALGLAPMPVRETDPDTGEERLRPASGTPTASDRLKAYSMIKVWGWGKEIERVALDATITPGAGPLAIDSLSTDDMVAMLDMARAARGALPELPPISEADKVMP